MTKQMTGPTKLRLLAETRPCVEVDVNALHKLAAQWEADIARADELGRRLSSKTMALQEAEESIDRLQSTKEDLTAEIKEFYAEREAFYESFRRSYDEETKKLHAALEQARALLAEQAEIITANVWHIPPEYSARNIVMDAAAKMRELAAALAAAPGGAA